MVMRSLLLQYRVPWKNQKICLVMALSALFTQLCTQRCHRQHTVTFSCVSCREPMENGHEKSAPSVEDIPEEPEDVLSNSWFGLFDEVDSMMGRHRHTRRPQRTPSLDHPTPGHVRSRSAMLLVASNMI